MDSGDVGENDGNVRQKNADEELMNGKRTPDMGLR